ncbi:hypothetical protein ABH917_001678 [Thermobifida halotolerans]
MPRPGRAVHSGFALPSNRRSSSVPVRPMLHAFQSHSPTRTPSPEFSLRPATWGLRSPPGRTTDPTQKREQEEVRQDSQRQPPAATVGMILPPQSHGASEENEEGNQTQDEDVEGQASHGFPGGYAPRIAETAPALRHLPDLTCRTGTLLGHPGTGLVDRDPLGMCDHHSSLWPNRRRRSRHLFASIGFALAECSTSLISSRPLPSPALIGWWYPEATAVSTTAVLSSTGAVAASGEWIRTGGPRAGRWCERARSGRGRRRRSRGPRP